MSLAVQTQAHGNVSLGVAVCVGKTGEADEEVVRYMFRTVTECGVDYTEGASSIIDELDFSAFVGDSAGPQLKAMVRLNAALSDGKAVLVTCCCHHLQHVSESVSRACDALIKERLGNKVQQGLSNSGPCKKTCWDPS